MGKKITRIEPVKHSHPLQEAAPRRVCAYCRVSTGHMEQKNSFDAQVQYYTRLIGEKPNWILAGVYADEARSGTKVKSREGFQQMLFDCRQGKIDLILTKSVTRFARNTVDSIQTIRMLKELGIEVYFEKERIGTLSEKSEQLLTILSSIAQGEAESISTNNRWSIIRRFQNGTYTISCPAYGYQNDEDGNLIPHPTEAPVVRRIFEEYLGGKGSYVIAKELQEEGIPTSRTARSWQDNAVKWILQNPVYEGDLLLQKTYTMEGVPFIKKHNHGERPMYLISDDHEPIISREEAAAVRRLYEYRRKRQCVEDRDVYQSRYAFSSRIICGECGGNFRRQKIYIGKPYEKIQWSCYRHITDRRSCSQKAVREDLIKSLFVRMWNKLAGNTEDILVPLLAVLKAIPNDVEREQESTELENRIQEIKRQSHLLRKVLLDGGMDSAVFVERRNLLDSELEEASRRQRLLKEKKPMEQEIAQTEFLLTVFRTRPVYIEDFEEELFCLITEKIAVYPDRLRFILKNGLELEERYGKEV